MSIVRSHSKLLRSGRESDWSPGYFVSRSKSSPLSKMIESWDSVVNGMVGDDCLTLFAIRAPLIIGRVDRGEIWRCGEEHPSMRTDLQLKDPTASSFALFKLLNEHDESVELLLLLWNSPSSSSSQELKKSEWTIAAVMQSRRSSLSSIIAPLRGRFLSCDGTPRFQAILCKLKWFENVNEFDKLKIFHKLVYVLNIILQCSHKCFYVSKLDVVKKKKSVNSLK